MKTTQTKNSSIDLTKAYRQAQVKILSSLRGSHPQTIRLNFTKTLQTVVSSLDIANANAVESSVADGMRSSQKSFVDTMATIFDGRAFTLKDLTDKGLDVTNKRVAADILDRNAKYARETAVYRQNFLELRGKLVGVSSALQGEVNETLKKLSGKAENTVVNAVSELRKRLKSQGCFNVQYGNGANVGVDKYATMVCRSARTESANAENVRISKAFGTDLVECVGNAVTCDVCAQYRGRVFSVSGEDKRYPPLRNGANSPLKNGYDLIHPNCRCEFRAYFEPLHSKEENEAKRKFSNRPFEGDKRTSAQARAYQEWQAINRRAVDEQSRWNEMQAVLGKDMPYKDIGALRRALRADKDSFSYKKSHYAVRDYRQYERWKSILGEENIPKSLAEFQDLKYNNSNKYECLCNYKFSVENGRMSPLVKFDSFATMKQRIEREIVGLTTVNGVNIKSQSKHFIERVFGSVEQRRSGVKLEDVKRCLTEGEIKDIRHTEDGESVVYRLKGVCKVSVNVSTQNLIQTSPD